MPIDGHLEPGLEALVLRSMTDHRVPGLAIAHAHPGTDVVAAFGTLGSDSARPVTAHTHFEIASITKTVVATMVGRLADEGLVALEAPVRTYLPDLELADRSVAERVTVRHLLAHTSGWLGDDLEDFGCDDSALARHVAGFVLLPQVIPLGVEYSYNNSGYCLLGRVIEAVTGGSFEQETLAVLRRIGLTSPAFADEPPTSPPRADGHFVTSDGALIKAERNGCGRAHNANGGLLFTPEDLLTYARFHLGDGRGSDGEAVLGEATLRAIHSPQGRASGTDSIGWSWFLREAGGVWISSHGGDGTGQQALLTVVRDAGYAVGVLTNSSRGRLAAEAIVNRMLAQDLGIKPPARIAVRKAGARLDAFVGRWTVPGRTIVVRRTGNSLRIRYVALHRPGRNNPPIPEMSAVLLTSGEALVVDGPFKDTTIDYLPGGDGVSRLRFIGRVFVPPESATWGVPGLQ